MKKLYIVFILQIFIAQFAFTAYCKDSGFLKIEVHPMSLIEDKEIRLGDIAWITGDNPQVVESAQSVLLTSAPVKDRPLLIRGSLIKRSLSRNGFDLEKITLETPNKITVKNKLTRISEENMKETIREYIYENMPWDKDQVDITEIVLKGDILLPQGESHQNITMGRNSDFIGKVSLDLEFTLNGKRFKRKRASANIKVLIPVVLAKVALKKGMIISENDIYTEKQWSSKIPLNIHRSNNEVTGKKLTRNIKAGQPFKESFLEIPNDLLKGNKVTIVAKIKNLKITAPGVAVEDGRIGEIVRVKNMDSKKIINAKVINNTTVSIDL